MERGYHEVGLDEVARDAGVSRQALYLHFKSKAELLVSTARHIDEMFGVTEILRPGREAKAGLEALDAGIRACGAIEPQIYDVTSVIYSARRSDKAAEAAWQDWMAFRRENARRGYRKAPGGGNTGRGMDCGRGGRLRLGPPLCTHV